MKRNLPENISYKRSRFGARLPVGYLYTPSHYWLSEAQPGLWRIGFTKFAIRMLGDLVECNFAVKPGEAVEIGQAIGAVEGFKAVAEIYCVVAGEFACASPQLEQDITLVESDPHGAGWLYEARGAPEPASVDVHGYIAILDATIDRMLGSRHEATRE
jgi:glycine cleavage system H protein